MIVSHKHRFIFLKTAKTAGTSIELALSRVSGEQDIITPLHRDDEALRKKYQLPGPKNYLKKLRDYNKKDWRVLLLKQKPARLFYNHMPAREAKEILGEEVWNNYFKFCFERNPWDRVISMYYWKNKRNKWNNISEFINKKNLKPLKKKGYYIYTIQNEVVVDKVYLYENLQEAMNDIKKRLDIDCELEVPKAKTQYRKKNIESKNDLDYEEIKFIERYFKEEVNLIGY